VTGVVGKMGKHICYCTQKHKTGVSEQKLNFDLKNSSCFVTYKSVQTKTLGFLCYFVPLICRRGQAWLTEPIKAEALQLKLLLARLN